MLCGLCASSADFALKKVSKNEFLGMPINCLTGFVNNYTRAYLLIPCPGYIKGYAFIDIIIDAYFSGVVVVCFSEL